MNLDERAGRRPVAGTTMPGIDGRVCNGCGSLAYPGDRYCACCGAQLLRLCRRCSAPVLQPVANYCTHCGQTLARLADTTAYDLAPPGDPD